MEFLIHKSLPDRNPIIVPRKHTSSSTLSNYLTPRSEVLHKNSNLTEILWNFSRFKDKNRRITLSQNPHFYAWLPTSPEEYGDEFKAEPIETFQQHARVHVLTDIQGPLGRVFVEAGQNTRIFDNVWIPNNAIIFKGETDCPCDPVSSIADVILGVHGRLEGEAIVGAAIRDKAGLQCFKESPLPPAPPWARSSRIQYTSSLFMAAQPRSFTEEVQIQDWREPIRRMLRPLDVNVSVNIRIIADLPSDSTPTHSARASPTPTGALSSSDGSLLRIISS